MGFDDDIDLAPPQPPKVDGSSNNFGEVPKKKGFFSKLFGKKEAQPANLNINAIGVPPSPSGEDSASTMPDNVGSNQLVNKAFSQDAVVKSEMDSSYDINEIRSKLGIDKLAQNAKSTTEMHDKLRNEALYSSDEDGAKYDLEQNQVEEISASREDESGFGVEDSITDDFSDDLDNDNSPKDKDDVTFANKLSELDKHLSSLDMEGMREGSTEDFSFDSPDSNDSISDDSDFDASGSNDLLNDDSLNNDVPLDDSELSFEDSKNDLLNDSDFDLTDTKSDDVGSNILKNKIDSLDESIPSQVDVDLADAKEDFSTIESDDDVDFDNDSNTMEDLTSDDLSTLSQDANDDDFAPPMKPSELKAKAKAAVENSIAKTTKTPAETAPKKIGSKKTSKTEEKEIFSKTVNTTKTVNKGKVSALEKPVKKSAKKTDRKTTVKEKELSRNLKKVETESLSLATELTGALNGKVVNVPINHQFIKRSGKLVETLTDLIDYVKTTDYKVFTNTIASNKAKFLSWMKSVVAEESAKRDILKSKIIPKVESLISTHEKKVKALLERFTVVSQKDLKMFEDQKQELKDELASLNEYVSELDLFKSKLEKTEQELLSDKEKLAKQMDLYNKKMKTLIEEFGKKEELLVKTAQQKEQERIKSYAEMQNDVSRKILDLKAHFKEKHDELNAREERLVEQFKQKKEILDKKVEHQVHLQSLREEKFSKQMELQKKQLEEEKAYIDNVKKSAETAERHAKKLEEHWIKKNADLEAEKNSFEAEKTKIESTLHKQETEILSSIDRDQRIKEDILAQKKKLLDLKKDVESEGFGKYLQEEMKRLNDDGVSVSPEDDYSHVDLRGNTEIYDLIDKCNDLIDSGNFKEAKKVYNSVRTKYANSNIIDEEKDILYNKIRELYDDINIAILKSKY